MILRRITVCFIVVLTLSLSVGQGLAQTPQPKLAYRYSYIIRESDLGAVNLQLVNPEDTVSEEQVITLPSKEGEFVYWVQVSPNGEWVSYIVDPSSDSGDPDASEGQIRLYNVLTGEVRNGYPRTVLNDMEWSPNSRYLAVNMNDDEFSHVQFATYIYDLETDQYHYVLEANTYRYGLTWSPDSTHLAAISSVCTQALCDAKIDVIKVPEYQVAQSTFAGGLGAPLCDFAWSPDNRYFSFAFTCDPVSFPYISDIFTLDISSGVVDQTTRFTQSLSKVLQFDDPYTLFRTFFDIVWYDSDHLLVGVGGGRFTDGIGYDAATVQVTTNSYYPDGTSKQISSAKLTNWVRNPVDKTLAFRSEEKVVRTDEYNMPQLFDQTVSVQVATLNGNDLNILHSVPLDACDLSWSPDGKYLAYIQYSVDGSTCALAYSVKRSQVYFLNQANGKITQSTLTQPYPLPVGWVTVAHD